jgi:hypothetical protein
MLIKSKKDKLKRIRITQSFVLKPWSRYKENKSAQEAKQAATTQEGILTSEHALLSFSRFSSTGFKIQGNPSCTTRQSSLFYTARKETEWAIQDVLPS